MATFTERVSNYPVVEESIKAVSEVYESAKNNECVAGVCNVVETAAAKIASTTKPLIESGVAQRLDELACHHILDRVEHVCPAIKETTTGELVDCVADRALSVAEGCINYCLPESAPAVQPSGDNPPSRRERLTCLQKRASERTVAAFHSSLDQASSLLNQLHTHAVTAASAVPTATIMNTLSKAQALLTSAYTTAKEIGSPIVATALSNIVSLAERLDRDLKQSNKLSGLDLQHLISALTKLQHTAASMDGTRKPNEHEMTILNNRDSEVSEINTGNASENLDSEAKQQ